MEKLSAREISATRRLALALGGACLWLTCCVAAPAQVSGFNPPTPTAEIRASSRRALVIGINDYRSGATATLAKARNLRDLRGAVRDAELLSEVLDDRGFTVRTLLDREASRAGILQALEEHLLAPARTGDDLVFFFAGHGSQAEGGDPDEPDQRDETLVPADAGAGAPDLRDDELRVLFHRALERGARLTILLDACHSGSAVRGLPEPGITRAAMPAPPRPAAKSAPVGALPPPLENGPTLILAASQEDQPAGETLDPQGEWRGAFSYALLQALATAAPAESAAMTFRRLEALLISDQRPQRPVLAGSPQRQLSPLFAADPTRGALNRDLHTAVVLGEESGEIFLEGGWTRGLHPGDELEVGTTLLRLHAVDPLRSRARRLRGEESLPPGTVFSRVRVGAPDVPDLVVFLPQSTLDAAQLKTFHKELVAKIHAAGHRETTTPWTEAPSHVIRYRTAAGWEIVDRSGETKGLGPTPAQGRWRSVLRALPASSLLVIQLPLPRGTRDHIELGDGRRHDRVGVSGDPAAAHYQLVGAVEKDSLSYRWVRPGAGGFEPQMPLPAWTRGIDMGDGRHDSILLGLDLTELAVRLARLRFLLRLQSPETDAFPYRLALFDGQRIVSDVDAGEPPTLRIGDEYGVVLVRRPELDSISDGHHIYVLLIDAHGEQRLLFPHPRHGSVENRLPLDKDLYSDAEVVPFGPRKLLAISSPAGLDTYILLTTNEPIPEPTVLSREGVRAPRASDHPLARWILESQRGTRSTAPLPTDWSIQRMTVRAGAAPVQ